ncbi:hypothetical protein [Rhizobium laguerreae]|uniref:hypothetical protein n=1 Tax=Rhizobium laguerreae TaxID=1076926 RepID=UPI001C920E2B|nr:hypothetical protein [Rhizobium laguerreae]MBY3369070.1 hypothetical protein [Rhizobium laguerreae]
MQNPSQDFLALMKTNIAKKREELDRLVSLVQRLKVELAEDERLYGQVEKYAKAEEKTTSAFVDKVAKGFANNLAPEEISTNVEQSTEAAGDSSHLNESQHIRAMAAHVVREAGRVMSSPQILAGILDTGYVFRSANPTELVKKALKRAPGLRKAGRGYWLKDAELPTDQSKTSKSKSASARRRNDNVGSQA